MNTRTAESGPFIAICMTTYNPPLELFKRQIQSIQEQTYRRWLCIIVDDCSTPDRFDQIVQTVGDDPRFRIHRNPRNLGFYENFEHCLALSPSDVQYIALCDQDDCWYADKLASLLAEFDAATTLVYSDARIVDGTGRQLNGTYWTTRDNNYTSLGNLLLANTVTGAASMFPRWLLNFILPFPERYGSAYHDHWIGCVALALGNLRYIDRPLYDYVQHEQNVIGHAAPPPKSPTRRGRAWLRRCLPFHIISALRQALQLGRMYYFEDLLRIQQVARMVRLRCGARVSPAKRAILRRVATISETWTSFLWLLVRTWRKPRARRVTLGVEHNLVKALIWHHSVAIKKWLMTTRTPVGWVAQLLRRWGAATGPAAPMTTPSAHFDGDRSGTPLPVIYCIPQIEFLKHVMAPLRLQVSAELPRRVNMLISIIDFKYMFGGYITLFNLARCLAEQGFRMRLIVVEQCEFRPDHWRRQFLSYPGLEDILDRVEVIDGSDRNMAVPVHPEDAFLATSWWTAHVAHQAARALNASRFVYVIQDYEPGFYPLGSTSAFAAQSYTFPHYALYSTELLRDYFCLNGLGVFAEGKATGEKHSAWFENTITKVHPVTRAEMAGRSPRRLLFYCRPEDHAMRNMYEVGLLALMRALQAGSFRGAWEFHGIGAVDMKGRVKLADGVFLHILPRRSQCVYRELLPDYDLGLSLMYTPHPSLVPLEMVSAGMLTVTNTYANKTSERLLAISCNFIPAEPTIEGVQRGLDQAATNIEDYDRRIRGAKVRWSTHWDQSFNSDVMGRLKPFLLPTSSTKLSLAA